MESNPYQPPENSGTSTTKTRRTILLWVYLLGTWFGWHAAFALDFGPSQLVRMINSQTWQWLTIMGLFTSVGAIASWVPLPNTGTSRNHPKRRYRFIGGFVFGFAPLFVENVLIQLENSSRVLNEFIVIRVVATFVLGFAIAATCESLCRLAGSKLANRTALANDL